MTNEQVQACATIFAICRKAMDKRSAADITNAQMFPLRGATLYVKELNQRRLATKEIDEKIAQLMSKIELEAMEKEFGECLPIEQQGVWMLAYAKEMGDSI